MSIPRGLALIGLLLLLAFAPAKAQPRAGIGVPRFTREEPDNHYRVTGSYGVNLGKLSDAPYAFDIMATYQNHSVAYSLGVLTSANHTNHPSQTTTDVDALIGYAWNYEITHSANKPDLLYFSLSSGVSVVTYSVKYRHRRDVPFDPNPFLSSDTFENGLGLPIVFQTIYEPTRYAGIGVTAFATFGKLKPNYGVLASIMVGWF